MNQAEMISEMESRAFALGLPIYQVCARAGIAPSTFWRWKTHAGGNFGKMAAVDAILTEIEAERASAQS